MRFAYADPPYEGMASRYAREARSRGGTASEVDHTELIVRLCRDFPDGWVLSLKTNSLRNLLPLCPPDARVLAWMKPFAPAYKGIRPVYSWEPLILVGGRAKEHERLVLDSLVMSPRMGVRPRQTNGPLGAKPPGFCRWVLDTLGYHLAEDEMVDLFPGSGIMGYTADQGVLA